MRPLRWKWLLVAGIVVAAAYTISLGFLATRDWAARRKFLVGETIPTLAMGETPSAENFAPEQVVERMPPLADSKFITADDVGEEVWADELVVGVAISGEARAYPINAMTGPDREVFNDHLADTAIAATW